MTSEAKGNAPIRVVVADDHTLFREGLAALVETDPSFTVIAQCRDGNSAIDVVRAMLPDIAVLDVEMPGPGARRTVETIRAEAPSVAVVIISMHEDPTLLRTLLAAGASAFLAKTVARDQLIAGLHSVYRSPENVLVSTSRDSLNSTLEAAPQTLLSPRELEVLQLVADALSNYQVGRQLGITEATVKRHLTNIYGKLGAISRVDCLRKAAALNLLDASGN